MSHVQARGQLGEEPAPKAPSQAQPVRGKKLKREGAISDINALEVTLTHADQTQTSRHGDIDNLMDVSDKTNRY